MKPKLAIACSGLGWVNRGNETWAATVADALHHAGAEVTLFGGGDGVHAACPYTRVANWRRDHRLTRSWLSWHNRYLLEQRTFARGLSRHLKQGRFDLVHMADPALAWIIQRARPGGSRRVIYKDGLLLGASWCKRFDCVQLLAPPSLEEARAKRVCTDNWFVIPHLVDVQKFTPATSRESIRAKLLGSEVRAETPVVVAVGDLSPGSNKRLDWIVKELARHPTNDAHLLVAGHSSKADCDSFVSQSKGLIGDRIQVITNLTAGQMPEVYQAGDIFVHAALREPFGIVFLEAMASGLPVIAHRFPVTEWIIGDAGQIVDMSTGGELAAVLEAWTKDDRIRTAIGRRARDRAVSEFSPGRIIPKYLEMYAQIRRGR
jgi:glycosyltransferase involved in cell wall biosynthesis